MSKPKRREFLLLADVFKSDKHDPIGMIGSVKLDGMRAFWDGGLSRGDRTVDVPWSSIHHPKTGELKEKIRPTSTGLWSRYGSPIQAPDWFLDQLPPEPLDGELYIGPGTFQRLMSAVKTDVPIDERWQDVNYVAFGAPTFCSVFQSGLIKNPNMLRDIVWEDCRDYLLTKVPSLQAGCNTYLEELEILDGLFTAYGNSIFNVVDTAVITSMEQLVNWTNKVTSEGGEGIMIRDPDSVWFPKRRPLLLKVKPRHDAECVVTGFVSGKKGKTGQLLGKLGTLECVWHGDPTAPCGLLKKSVAFEIGTGLTHEQRALHDVDVPNAKANPGKPLTGLVSCTPHFQIGDRLTFSYMGVFDDNAPREPSFTRKRNG